jgi:secondary thiamine-phosphate synthase enzyme
MLFQKTIRLETRGRGSYPVTRPIQEVVKQSGIQSGLCHVFLQHTSASLMLCENADPDVRTDLENFMTRLVPDGDAIFAHVAEGPDDMPAHVRSILTHSDLTLPVSGGSCCLGTWQGVYLWEHRRVGHRRQIITTIQGD